MSDYQDFLARKSLTVEPCGIDDPPELADSLFDFQRDITRWALRIGRAAIWADCGLGKTRMAIEWARVVAAHTGRPALILTPLAVAQQFVAEGAAIDVDVRYLADPDDAEVVTVTNYEKLHRFEPGAYGGIVLDESSVIKDHTSKTRNGLMAAFAATRFKLCCTATPAPNDFIELGNHAQFLGAMTQKEMLSMFFFHDGGSVRNWRMKGHAEADFWAWISSWAVNVKKPSDLGYSDDGYSLPPLKTIRHVVDSNGAELAKEAGVLFADEAKGLAAQRAARRASLSERVAKCAELVNASDADWIIWCDMNDESTALTASIDGAVEVTGSMPSDEKERRLNQFSERSDGRRILISKPSIAGHGMNWQHCHHVAFVGVSHSFEKWYQAIRRCWRFGQKMPVQCHVITSAAEGSVMANLRRKQDDSDRLTRGMVANMADLSRAQLEATSSTKTAYNPNAKMRIPQWLT